MPAFQSKYVTLACLGALALVKGTPRRSLCAASIICSWAILFGHLQPPPPPPMLRAQRAHATAGALNNSQLLRKATCVQPSGMPRGSSSPTSTIPVIVTSLPDPT